MFIIHKSQTRTLRPIFFMLHPTLFRCSFLLQISSQIHRVQDFASNFRKIHPINLHPRVTPSHSLSQRLKGLQVRCPRGTAASSKLKLSSHCVFISGFAFNSRSFATCFCLRVENRPSVLGIFIYAMFPGVGWGGVITFTYLRTPMMLRHGTFTCTCAHTSCYVKDVSRHAGVGWGWGGVG